MLVGDEKTQNETRFSVAEIRRRRVAELVLLGKTEDEIAAELEISRGQVARIKADERTQERIRKRVEDAATLTNDEIMGVLASHQRIDITEAFEVGENPFIDRLREKGLGHLIKAFTAKRTLEGPEDEKRLIEIDRVEFHNSQTAAIHLSRIKGMEKAPAPNDAEAKRELAQALLEKALARGISENEAVEQLIVMGIDREDLIAA